ncbi:MAG: FxsA family protein [Devosiaceae bacterium]|uniref:FxsA protein n=1 Tax=hydrothermal vent metagenome TaxID=652676 RepID=A0A3B0REP3_9ZZZZ|nr:FxsA family protein [Devosiaceae bacterium]
MDNLFETTVIALPLVLFTLFVLIPILEIATFIQVGSLVGLPLTLLGIVLTAVIGAILVRQQGFKALNDARENMAQQKSPVEQVVHGVFILIAGLLLLTPGFLTDSIGFLFLIPPLRLSIANRVWSWIKENGTIDIQTGNMSGSRYEEKPGSQPDRQDSTIIEGKAVEVEDVGKPETPWRPPTK